MQSKRRRQTHRAQLVADYEKSRAYLEAAREIAGNLRAEVREQGIDMLI